MTGECGIVVWSLILGEKGLSPLSNVSFCLSATTEDTLACILVRLRNERKCFKAVELWSPREGRGLCMRQFHRMYYKTSMGTLDEVFA